MCGPTLALVCGPTTVEAARVATAVPAAAGIVVAMLMGTALLVGALMRLRGLGRSPSPTFYPLLLLACALGTTLAVGSPHVTLPTASSPAPSGVGAMVAGTVGVPGRGRGPSRGRTAAAGEGAQTGTDPQNAAATAAAAAAAAAGAAAPDAPAVNATLASQTAMRERLVV